MSYNITEIPKLFAFDLDGTILDSKKELSEDNSNALKEMAQCGSIIAFASGRIKSSIDRYIEQCRLPVAVVSLNGAAVYKDYSFDNQKIYSSTLPGFYADQIIKHSLENKITINYYLDDTLYTIKTPHSTPWIDLYINQTSSRYTFIDSFDSVSKSAPSKIIMLGSPELLDAQQAHFSQIWSDEVYICRTWDFYLEFLNPSANKGSALKALAESYGINIKDVIAFGDAENDIPMLQEAGMSIAVKNSTDSVKSSAKRISQWTNDENCIAHEWDEIKKTLSI